MLMPITEKKTDEKAEGSGGNNDEILKKLGVIIFAEIFEA